jgi:hypothetical protein
MLHDFPAPAISRHVGCVHRMNVAAWTASIECTGCAADRRVPLKSLSENCLPDADVSPKATYG